jgi:hypothetical protein
LIVPFHLRRYKKNQTPTHYRNNSNVFIEWDQKKKIKVEYRYLKLNVIACYASFQEHFPARAVDHSYDDVHRVNYLEKTEDSGRPNKRTVEVDNAREIMEATPLHPFEGLES